MDPRQYSELAVCLYDCPPLIAVLPHIATTFHHSILQNLKRKQAHGAVLNAHNDVSHVCIQNVGCKFREVQLDDRVKAGSWARPNTVHPA